MNIKNIISKTGIAFILGFACISGSVVYAMATIPAGCETPGDCDQLTPSLLELTVQNIVRLTDADDSNFVELQAPTDVTSNVTFTLPAEDGNAGEELRTDGSGNLSFDQVSKRVGEFIHAKSGRTAADGYLAVVPGTVTGGATDYPVWAALYPEFVSGSDIVFPANVNGIFLRNIGGNAGAEGVFQADATARPNSNFVTSSNGTNQLSGFSGTAFALLRDNGGDLVDTGDSGGITNSNSSSADRVTISQNATHNHTITSGGDAETRPFNYAYQLYTIVDTY